MDCTAKTYAFVEHERRKKTNYFLKNFCFIKEFAAPLLRFPGVFVHL